MGRVISDFDGIIDESGTWVIGDPEKGCRDCGGVTAAPGREGGNVVWWHPSVECCVPAIDRQIGWRRGEIAQLRAEQSKAEAAVRDLQAGGAPAGRVESAQRALRSRIDGYWSPEIRELATEIRRLEGERARFDVPSNMVSR